MLSKSNLKNYKRTLIFLTTIILFLASFTLIQYQILQNNSIQNSKVLSTLEDNEWGYVWSNIQALHIEAITTTDLIAKEIKKEILNYYGSNKDKLLDDLDSLDSVNNPIIAIISRNILGYYLNNVVSDADDMWVATRSGIISDFSVDCSTKEGRTRSFSVEISNHYNKILAAKAIDNILNMSNDLIGWQFVTPVNPKYTTNYFTEDSIHQLYTQYGLDSLQSFEIENVAYINRTKDLLGKYLVDTTGHIKNNNQLIIVQGFNIVNQFKDNQNVMVTLQEFKDQRAILIESFRVQYLLECIGIISTFAMTLLVFVVGTILLQNEKIQLESKQDC